MTDRDRGHLDEAQVLVAHLIDRAKLIDPDSRAVKDLRDARFALEDVKW